MAAKTISTEVVGIKALTEDLLKLANDHSSQLLPYLQQAAQRALTPTADTLRSTLPHRSGRLAGSVRVAKTRTGARISEGSDDVIYAGPVDFGGYPPPRPYLANGRYLFPVVQSTTAQAERIYNQAVSQALGRIHWTNETTDAGAVHD